MTKLPGALLGILLAVGAGRAPAQSGAPPASQTAPANGGAPSPCTPQKLVDVLTHRNNNFRTGANLDETCLTPDNVNAKTFGKLFTLSVRGQIYAQPLIAASVEIQGQTRNVLYVATMENWVYAFDADGRVDATGSRSPLWERSLGPSLPVNRIPRDIGAALGKYNIEPLVGITSTPVIDRETSTVFLVAKIARIASPEMNCDNQVSTPECPVVSTIFALDLRTGDIRDSQDIRLPPPELTQIGHDCGALDRRTTTALDAARINLQRAALLFNQGRIYLGFGSHQDAPCPMYHGMLIAFDFDPTTYKLSQSGDPFMVSRIGETDTGINLDQTKLGKGGIWQAGNGPAADEAGNVYVMTGNGAFEPGKQFGSNLVKFSPDLKKVEWFAPANVDLLNADALDIDLGSSGPVLLPGSDEAIGGGKQGRLYLVKRSAPGGSQRRGWPHDHTGPPIQFFWAAHRWQPEFLYGWFPISLFAFATGYHHVHGAPAFWGEPDAQGVLQSGALYVWPERDHVKAFAYKKAFADKDGKFTTKPTATGPKSGLGMPGGFLSVSAHRMENGVLWAALPMHDDAWIDIVRGSLRAFRITPDGKTLSPLWTSYCAEPEDKFNFAKYVPPTVANGKVYLATFSGFVNVYGLRTADASRQASANDPDCKVSEFMMEPNYKKTNKAAQGHVH
jgi:outer membrane protein assembly factor BamB